jgi:hypothetical protein
LCNSQLYYQNPCIKANIQKKKKKKNEMALHSAESAAIGHLPAPAEVSGFLSIAAVQFIC